MSRRTAGLFLAALLGVLAALGVAAASLGWVALGPYLALVVVLLATLVRRARALAPRPSAQPTGRTCTCCTSTVHDPVEVR